MLIASTYNLMTLPAYFPIILALVGVVLISVGEMLALPFINTFFIKGSSEATQGNMLQPAL